VVGAAPLNTGFMLQGAMPPRFKAVLFDHDGTLVASEELHFAHWQQVLACYGAALTESF
jgi:FMN phosphatase YigB (HAD superfamily)